MNGKLNVYSAERQTVSLHIKELLVIIYLDLDTYNSSIIKMQNIIVTKVVNKESQFDIIYGNGNRKCRVTHLLNPLKTVAQEPSPSCSSLMQASDFPNGESPWEQKGGISNQIRGILSIIQGGENGRPARWEQEQAFGCGALCKASGPNSENVNRKVNVDRLVLFTDCMNVLE